MTDYDFIGDIHGYSDKLEALLLRLDYRRKGKGFKHSHRKAFFVGDYIDRGPNNPRVIEIVRAMVDTGAAIALCGNHEHNAICFNFITKNGYLREHSIKNIKQHWDTLQQFHGSQSKYNDAISWFKTLPMYYEAEVFNVVHATYDAKAINYLKSSTNQGILSDEDYASLVHKNSALFNAVETTCKGKEMKLPNGQSFLDKDGNKRFHIRVKWWLNPATTSLKDLSFTDEKGLPTIVNSIPNPQFYDQAQKPVFFGHYWLEGEPNLYRDNICCLDYSVAKGNYLVAYRFSGEDVLNDGNLVYV